MKPPRFSYVAPTTLDNALELLAQLGEDAKVLSGGQSLVPLMNLRFARPSYVIDVNRIESLSYIREDGDTLCIGSLTRHQTLSTSPLVQRRCPLLAAAASQIGYPAIRYRGTIGGSLAHADPVAELPCIAVTLGAEIVIERVGAERRVMQAADFLRSVFTTALEPDEMITEVRVPCIDGPGSRWGFREFARKRGDFAIVICAVVVELRDGTAASTRIGIAGASDTAVRSSTAEATLDGVDLDRTAVVAASHSAATAATPISDAHASSEYRRHLVEVLTQRTLHDALRSQGGAVG